MDPAQALLNAESHLAAGNRIDAAESLAAYRAWRQSGGFELINGNLRAGELERQLYCAGLDHDDDHGAAVTLAATVDTILAGLLRRAETER